MTSRAIVHEAPAVYPYSLVASDIVSGRRCEVLWLRCRVPHCHGPLKFGVPFGDPDR